MRRTIVVDNECPIRKKCRRLNAPGHAHELTFSCYRGQPLLCSQRARGYLAEAISRSRQKHSFHVWAYVLMPEHVHLLLWPTEQNYSISKMLLSIKQPVSRGIMSYLREHNPAGLRVLATGQRRTPYRFWLAGGGYDRNITSAETARKTVEYIHNNPVRRGLVAAPEEWVWSSAGDWAGRGPGKVVLDLDSFPMA
jgi:putative transposase